MRSAEVLQFPRELTVIGGGIAGCLTALKAASADPAWKVTILERAPELLLGSSNATPGREGQGFHYPKHFETAELLLRRAIEFKREFPGFHIGEGEEDPNHFLKRGLYLIAKASQVSKREILETFRKLRQVYADLVDKDPKNEVFGEPDNFFQILDPKHFKGTVNIDLIDSVVQTCEQLLDWPKFREHILTKLSENKNITIITQANATKIKYRKQGKLKIEYEHGQETIKKTITTPYLVNCTWERADEFDIKMGFKTEADLDRTLRLKVLAILKPPVALLEESSKFVMCGPFCMTSNRGKDLWATYAPVTNVANFTGLGVPKDWANLYLRLYDKVDPQVVMPELEIPEDGLQGDFKDHLKEYYGSRIRAGLTQFFPQMIHAEIVDVQFGFVISQGEADIYDPDSGVHQRSFAGVEELGLGYLTNRAMKLIFGPSNAKDSLMLLEKHVAADQAIVDGSIKDHGGNVDKAEKFLTTARFYPRKHFFDLLPSSGTNNSPREPGAPVPRKSSQTLFQTLPTAGTTPPTSTPIPIRPAAAPKLSRQDAKGTGPSSDESISPEGDAEGTLLKLIQNSNHISQQASPLAKQQASPTLFTVLGPSPGPESPPLKSQLSPPQRQAQ